MLRTATRSSVLPAPSSSSDGLAGAHFAYSSSPDAATAAAASGPPPPPQHPPHEKGKQPGQGRSRPSSTMLARGEGGGTTDATPGSSRPRPRPAAPPSHLASGRPAALTDLAMENAPTKVLELIGDPRRYIYIRVCESRHCKHAPTN